MVRTGLDLWVADPAPDLRTLRLGLVSHPAAVLHDLTGAVDALRTAGYQLTALFGPEHGFGGAALDGATVSDVVDARTGLPIYSLYGEMIEPSQEALSKVDALVFDMQDVGARFYTYLSTLYYVLKAAGKAGKPVFVLDRPNPVTGAIVEGGCVEPGFESFVGIINVPMRHGMTLGELAQLMNANGAFGADLRMVPMQNWRRQMWFDETGLPWVPTSPAMPHLSTAILYPGMCLLEGTNLSLGRGTALPFEICGAPWLESHSLAERLNALDQPGARFRPFQFTPAADRYAGELCHGVQVHVTEREVLRPVSLALHIIATVRALQPRHFKWSPHFDRLTGDSRTRAALENGCTPDDLLAEWAETQTAFAQLRSDFLLYD